MEREWRKGYGVNNGQVESKVRVIMRQFLIHVLPIFFMLTFMALAMAWVAM